MGEHNESVCTCAIVLDLCYTIPDLCSTGPDISSTVSDPFSTVLEFSSTVSDLSSIDPEIASIDSEIASTEPKIYSTVLALSNEPDLSSIQPQISSTEPDLSSTSTTMAPQLAYLGMGNMGRVWNTCLSALYIFINDQPRFQAMAKNLVLKGNLENPLILHNRTLSRTKSVSERIGHSIVAETVTDAVTPSDIIFSCLVDSDAVNETFSTILKGDMTGKLFVECSTISPELTDELALKLHEAGAEFVAMPGKLIFVRTYIKPGDLWLIQVHNSVRRTSNG